MSNKNSSIRFKDFPLTEQQVLKIEKLDKDIDQLRAPIRMEYLLKNKEISQELLKTSIDTTKIFTIFNSMTPVHIELRRIQNHYFIEKQMIYTREQREDILKKRLDAIERNLKKLR